MTGYLNLCTFVLAVLVSVGIYYLQGWLERWDHDRHHDN